MTNTAGYFTRRGGLLVVTAPAAFAVLLSAPCFAGSLPLPSSNNLDFSGPALKVVNTHILASAFDPLPSALFGQATQSSGVGVFGVAQGGNGIAVNGVYNGTVTGGLGFAGSFVLTSPRPASSSAAIFVSNKGGQNTTAPYGSAAVFETTNPHNSSSAVTINAVGITPALRVTSSKGAAVFGISGSGLSAQFSGGSGGSGTCSYDGSAGFNCPSDRNLKHRFERADLPNLLEKLGKLPMFFYQMKNSDLPTRYVGPTAQDFRAAFDVGKDDVTINTANAQGVALAAAKGLYEKAKADEKIIAALEARVAELNAQVADFKTANARTASLQQQVEQQATLLSGLAEEVAALSRRNSIREASVAP